MDSSFLYSEDSKEISGRELRDIINDGVDCSMVGGDRRHKMRELINTYENDPELRARMSLEEYTKETFKVTSYEVAPRPKKYTYIQLLEKSCDKILPLFQNLDNNCADVDNEVIAKFDELVNFVIKKLA